MSDTFRLHRVPRTSPDRVHRAFLNPEAKLKWLPPRVNVEIPA